MNSSMINNDIVFMRAKMLLLALIGLAGSNVSCASNNDPAISLGVMGCGQTYLVQLFDSGWVEYRGLRGINTVGRQNTAIDPSIVNDLLKQAEDGGFFLADNRMRFIHWGKFPNVVVKIQQGDKTATLLESKEALSLQNEILKIKEISKWIGNAKDCMSHGDVIGNKDLKLKN